MLKPETLQDYKAGHPLRVHQVRIGEEQVAAACTYDRSSDSVFYLAEPAITSVVQGYKMMLINHQEYHLKAGDSLYIPAQTVVFTHIEATEQELFVSFNLLPQKLPFVAEQGLSLPREVSFVDRQTYGTRVQKAVSAKAMDAKSLPMELQSEISAWLDGLKIDSEPEAFPEEMNYVVKLLLNDVYDEHTLPELAATCNMSTATFNRKFKQYLGETPNSWLRQLRLQAAYFALKTGDHQVSEISEWSAFDNLSHFSQVLRKQSDHKAMTLKRKK